MLKKIGNFFHKLLNPHCTQCAYEAEAQRLQFIDDNECKACEVRQTQLDIANTQILRLTDQIIRLSSPVEVIRSETPMPQPVMNKAAMSFSARRAEMERLSRNEKNREKQVLEELKDSDRVKLPNLSVEVMEKVITGSN